MRCIRTRTPDRSRALGQALIEDLLTVGARRDFMEHALHSIVFWSYINPYGRFRLDMPRGLDLDPIAGRRIAARSLRSGPLRWSVR